MNNKKYLLCGFVVPEQAIKHNEEIDGELTFEKAMSIKGDFVWVDSKGNVRVYCKMREFNFNETN